MLSPGSCRELDSKKKTIFKKTGRKDIYIAILSGTIISIAFEIDKENFL